MKVIIISPPIGPLGSGLCGGVEITLYKLAKQMNEKGHQLLVVSPQGSHLGGIALKEIGGNYQRMMQLTKPQEMISLPGDSVLENMCDYVQQIQSQYDIILNFAYDWLPIYLTGFYQRPIIHWLTMCSCSDALDIIIYKTLRKFPHHIAVFTQAQANTFTLLPQNSLRVLGNGIDLINYQFNAKSDPFLAWVGRISPEKGLEDAFAAAQKVDMPLKIMGCMQDPVYWQQVCSRFPEVKMEYLGFLSTHDLQKSISRAKALLVTSKCMEAFGNVAIEALACGVPVIAYRQGGLTEIVRHLKTGYLVNKDDIEGLVEGINYVDKIDRSLCRKQAENEFSFENVYQRVMRWFQDVIELRGKK